MVHQIIREQLEFRKNLRGGHIVGQASIRPWQPDELLSASHMADAHVAALEALSLQSVDILLQSGRAQTHMFPDLLHTGIMQSAALFLRDLIATAQFMAEVPTNEQGYPINTPGGCDWTWPVKQKEVTNCIEALYQLGWAWADIAGVIDNLLVTMERMTPTSEELEKWRACPPQVDPKVREKQEEQHKHEVAALNVALKFWPPK
jgi:hypothetical protein